MGFLGALYLFLFLGGGGSREKKKKSGLILGLIVKV